MAVEFRDEDTGAHIERIGRLSTLLAEQIGMDPDFCAAAQPRRAAARRRQGGDPRRDPAEARTAHARGARDRRDARRGGAQAAARLVLLDPRDGDDRSRSATRRSGTAPATRAASSGEAIPIEGRIVAIADVFDALTSDRVYRKAFPVDEAVQMMREQRGRHFDPVLLDAFMEVLEQLRPRRARERARRPERARREHARDLRHGARARRRRDGRGRDRAGDRGRHPGDDAARRGDRPGAAADPRAAQRRRDRQRPRAAARRASRDACSRRSTAT